MASDKSEPWQVPLVSLGNTLSEARELAAVLEETLGVRIDYGTVILRSAATPQLRGHTFKERLLAGIPIPIDDRSINWSLLRGVVSTESLKDGETDRGAHPGHVQLEVNSGGRVFFCFFAPTSAGEPEGVAVLKFGPNRLLMQAEQFANELTRHLDICAPDCRIVRQAGPSSDEWKALTEACVRLGGSGGGSAVELASELAQMPVALLMEYCPGRPLLQCEEAFLVDGPSPEARSSTFEELGRLFLLDAVLGNADRLPCGDLCWRGNPNNVLFGRAGSRCAAHIVAIDSCVQRRPPAARVCAEDAGVDRLAQLLLTDQDFTLELLRGSVLAQSPPGLAALSATPAAATDAFRRGFRDCLRLVERIKGLLEMMYSKMDEWSVEFIKDIKELRPELPIPNPAPPGPASGPSSVNAGGSRLVAHYAGLNIRVSPAPGGSVSSCGGSSGGGRNRSQLGCWAGSGAVSNNSSGVGSPVRGRGSPSPYLTSNLRGSSRSRNSSHGGGGGGGGGGGLPDGIGSGPSSLLRRRGSLAEAVAAAAVARAATITSAAAAAVTTSSTADGAACDCDGATRTDGYGRAATASPPSGDGHAGKRAAGIGASSGSGGDAGRVVSPFAAGSAEGASTGHGSGADQSSPRNAQRRNQQLQQRPLLHQQSLRQQRQRSDGAGGSWNRSSMGGNVAPAHSHQLRLAPPPPQRQRQQNRMKCRGSGLSPEVAAAVAEMPEWLARSPYLVSGPVGGGNSGLVAMVGCWRALTPSGGRRCVSVSISSRSASVSHGNTNNSSSNSCTTPSSCSNGNSGASGGMVRIATTPQSRLAPPVVASAKHDGNDAAAPSLSTTPQVPHLARMSSPAGTHERSDTVVTQAAVDVVRRATDVFGNGNGESAASDVARSLQNLTVHAAARDPDTGSRYGGDGRGGRYDGTLVGKSLGSSPLRPLQTRIRITGSGGGIFASADSLNCTMSGLRHTRSFGLLRSPRYTVCSSNSPRRMLSPATPRFRSPILEPLPLANLAPLGSAVLPQDSTNGALQGVYCSDGGGAAITVSGAVAVGPSQAWMPKPATAAMPRQHPSLCQHQSDAPPATVTASATGPSAAAPKPPLPRACSVRTSFGAAATQGDGGGGNGVAAASSAAAVQSAPQQGELYRLQRREDSPLGLAVAGPSHPHGSPTGDLTITTTYTATAATGAGGCATGPAPGVGRGGAGWEEPGFNSSHESPPLGHPTAAVAATPTSTGSSPLGHFFRMRSQEHEGHQQQNQRLQALGLQGQRQLHSYTNASPSGAGASMEPVTPFCFHAPGATQVATPQALSLASASGPPVSAVCSTPHKVVSTAASSTASPSSRPSPLSRTPPSVSATPCTPTAGGTSAGDASALTAIATPVSTSPASGASVRTTAANTVLRRNGGGGRGRAGGGSGSSGSGGGANVASRTLYRAASRGTPGSLYRGVGARGSPAKGNPYDQLKSDMSLTLALKSITSEARKDDLLSNRVQHWKELFRNRGEELKAAVGEWQSRHRLDKVLTTGFLDGTHPIVDTYELKVRLEHMLRRLQVLQEAAGAEKPSEVLSTPRALFLGGAVAADSHHILRHLGITHIVNSTEELLLPDPAAGFVVLRVALRDVDDEDISKHFGDVCEFIQSCHAAGGSVLVHCSEGKSRSVTLVLAYLMRVRGWRLKAAFDHVKSRRPVACPNAGFMSKLLLYERDLFGDNSYISQQLKKAKPEPVMCPVCGAAVGISSASLAVHIKRAHPDTVQPQGQLRQAQGRAATAPAAPPTLPSACGAASAVAADAHPHAPRFGPGTRVASATAGSGSNRASAAAVSTPARPMLQQHDVQQQPQQQEGDSTRFNVGVLGVVGANDKQEVVAAECEVRDVRKSADGAVAAANAAARTAARLLSMPV
ncbi:hypothetical protein Vretimale_12277 [Volvox reticuliferus]|uniref:Dual specificity protein phosphatase n=1 Tax=Volvox reticuliferus TaxID=1737510 RepID=A0A8J4GJT8_9CHLO|nr:hypothetical protein Vretimale_12277 [Volvox reticuliferus]